MRHGVHYILPLCRLAPEYVPDPLNASASAPPCFQRTLQILVLTGILEGLDGQEPVIADAFCKFPMKLLVLTSPKMWSFMVI